MYQNQEKLSLLLLWWRYSVWRKQKKKKKFFWTPVRLILATLKSNWNKFLLNVSLLNWMKSFQFWISLIKGVFCLLHKQYCGCYWKELLFIFILRPGTKSQDIPQRLCTTINLGQINWHNSLLISITMMISFKKIAINPFVMSSLAVYYSLILIIH